MIFLLTPDETFDAHPIYPGLWQGSAPKPKDELHKLGYQLLVLCAAEYQPPATLFPGLEVVHAPNDDDPHRAPTRDELRIAMNAAQQVVQALQEEKKVLVTCWAGRNRSGLVSAIALHKLLGISGNRATTIVQMCRPKALTNPQFQACLARIPAKR
jgi:protein-tyrosine phosphatase